MKIYIEVEMKDNLGEGDWKNRLMCYLRLLPEVKAIKVVKFEATVVQEGPRSPFGPTLRPRTSPESNPQSSLDAPIAIHMRDIPTDVLKAELMIRKRNGLDRDERDLVRDP